MTPPDLEKLLQSTFDARHVKAALKHFQAMTIEFQQSASEGAISKGGKFIEAVLKALYVHVGQTLPPARKFSAGTVIDHLEHRLPSGSFDDTVRITMPRACRFAYDIASNRGARHDPTEVDPNQMDARVVVATAAWILAEMLRYAQKGSLDPDAVRELVDSLTQRQYPLIESVDGRVYFHVKNASARDVALLALWHKHPGRVSVADLVSTIVRHHFSRNNAIKAVSRIERYVDIQASGLRLLQPGLSRADKLISSAKSSS